MTTDPPAAASPLRRRGPSMQDVARLAGVSGQTVSRVANGRHNVDAATRERVTAAMRELGYRPNRAARALRSGRSQSIGVIAFEMSSLGTTGTLAAIAAAAIDRGYAVNLLPVLDATQDAVATAFDRLGEQAVDGVIILIEAHVMNLNVALPAGLPLVVVDSTSRFDCPVVDTDQAQGARLATEHLLDLGHETVCPETPATRATSSIDGPRRRTGLAAAGGSVVICAPLRRMLTSTCCLGHSTC